MRTFELRRFYVLLDLAGQREHRGDDPASALNLARQNLERAKARALDGPGEIAAAARSYRLALDTRKQV